MKDALADLPIYVINLNTPKYRVKREFMQKQLDDLGLAFEFLDATDDRQTLTAEEIDLLGGKEMLFKYVNNPDTPQGSVGCIISHFRCYKKLLASPHPYCLILEDDAALSADSLVVLRNLLQRGEKWNLIRLGYFIPYIPKDQLFFGKSIFPLNFLACRRLNIEGELSNRRPYYLGPLAFQIKGTYAYLISREGAELALQCWTSPIQHLDVTMNLAPLPHQFAVAPGVFGHEDFASSATGWEGEYIPFRPSGIDLPYQIKNKPAIIRPPDFTPLPAGTSQWKKIRWKIRWRYYMILNTWKILFVRKTA